MNALLSRSWRLVAFASFATFLLKKYGESSRKKVFERNDANVANVANDRILRRLRRLEGVFYNFSYTYIRLYKKKPLNDAKDANTEQSNTYEAASFATFLHKKPANRRAKKFLKETTQTAQQPALGGSAWAAVAMEVMP